ncbi:MAG: bifunctional 4-hydroxy-3-methylbut-2-enyl diphosphate reductase/30S ribosomal protein S1 [Clostridia bacterium]|nr:bifunctional 4-hydroxy-3-methylbut-2-enyl diphosphate reductase/30S ribosomal protein S1 [Clostridia bacterium]
MIKVAKTAGFCYGVKRAVDGVYKEIDSEKKIATLGHLIHNPQVIDDLEGKGVISYDSVSEIPKDYTVVIRAHGVGKNIYDELEGRKVIDLTCPFVSKIHRIVSEHHDKGYQIVIVGDKNHPEVIGINGWCGGEAVIINDVNYKIDENLAEKDLCIVAQTTINREFFGEIVQNIKKTCKSTLVFDTICSATKDRQKEADEISRNSDMMIVIGGKESSNTRKLFEISKRNCPVTYHIETFEDLPQEKTYNKIGITAGASTPGSIIEEVVKAMSENVKNEENFAELFAQYESKTLNNGDIIDGTVVEVRNNEVIVDLGGFKYNGQLAADQLTDDPSLKPSDVVKEGDTIKVYVVGVNDGEGKVVLSRKKLVAMESWNKIKAAYESEEILEGKIVKAVKGGVIALTDGSQVFIPARQASGRFVQDLQSLVGTTVNYKIIEIDERRRRVIGSVRVIIEAERKAKEDKFWADVEVGKKYQGTVKSLTSFGAFVDIGGVDGLVHISELSWNKIKHPSEVVKEGDVLDVYIKDINAETKKISLGFKKIEDNPWTIAQSKINVGDVVKCKIVRMMPFGAFAEIMPNVDGLIHISQIADRRIGKPEDVLTIGEEVEAKVTDLNWDEKKISLSIRALIPVPEKEEEAEEEAPAEPQKAETLVYSTDPDVEVEEAIEIEPAEEEEAPVEEAPAEDAE